MERRPNARNPGFHVVEPHSWVVRIFLNAESIRKIGIIKRSGNSSTEMPVTHGIDCLLLNVYSGQNRRLNAMPPDMKRGWPAKAIPEVREEGRPAGRRPLPAQTPAACACWSAW
jgi:hypothetical protein